MTLHHGASMRHPISAEQAEQVVGAYELVDEVCKAIGKSLRKKKDEPTFVVEVAKYACGLDKDIIWPDQLALIRSNKLTKRQRKLIGDVLFVLEHQVGTAQLDANRLAELEGLARRTNSVEMHAAYMLANIKRDKRLAKIRRAITRSEQRAHLLASVMRGKRR